MIQKITISDLPYVHSPHTSRLKEKFLSLSYTPEQLPFNL